MRKGEVQLFLQQNKIDILLVSQTHFTTKIHFQIPQYNTYYTNHPDGNAHAGTAILVKQTRASLPFKMSSTKGATSTEPNYNLIQTHSYNPYKGTISHGDWNEDGQMTCNQE
jgi:exonuclease III